MLRRVFLLVLLAAASAAHAVPNASPPKPDAPLVSVGTALMLDDGTIRLRMRSSTGDGGIVETIVLIKPADRSYRDTLARIGGLKPGEEKPFAVRPDKP